MLQRFGYTVLTASDGLKALEVYRNEQENISLIILDVVMPRMEGKELGTYVTCSVVHELVCRY